MSGPIPPLPQYAFMAWCSVKAQGQIYLYLYECETWSLTLRKGHRLRVSRANSRILGCKREEANCIMSVFVIVTLHQTSLGSLYKVK
jgi:hypothetical protein